MHRKGKSEIVRRARAHWRADGLPMLVAAGIYLSVVCGLLAFGYFVHRLPSLRHNSFVDNFVGPVFVLLFITSPFWILAFAIWVETYWEDIIEWWKGRLTYPRTGYVAPPSYWKHSAEIETLQPESKIERTLQALGSFWLWLFVLLLLSAFSANLHRRSYVILLTTLLAVRVVRVALYPARTTVSKHRSAWMRRGALVWPVLNSFWVWFFLFGLFPAPNAVVRPFLWPGILLGASVLAFPFIVRRRGRFDALCISTCGMGCAFLAFKDTSVSIALAWLAPGFCGAFIGISRLIRTLRIKSTSSV